MLSVIIILIVFILLLALLVLNAFILLVVLVLFILFVVVFILFQILFLILDGQLVTSCEIKIKYLFAPVLVHPQQVSTTVRCVALLLVLLWHCIFRIALDWRLLLLIRTA